MADTAATIEYFKKLLKVIHYDADLTFLDVKLIKKSKIDDVLCCILATLPDTYKKLMRQKEGDKFDSILCYKLMFKALKRKFLFNSNVYLVETNNAIKFATNVLKTLEKDIEKIERDYD
ncbi:hypothetical protein IJ750_05975 [bacterium]|nr:hypothetical protein [bacterium]MBR1776602.1 hypothetical protein [bacterium]